MINRVTFLKMKFRRFSLQQQQGSQEAGNVFTLVFAAVAAIAVITVNVTSTLTGPLDTVSNLAQISNADTQVLLSARLVVAESVLNQANNGDIDNDGAVEPPQFIVDATLGLTGGGRVPSDFGISKTDTWGTPIGYCVWDHGPTFTAAENRLQGDLDSTSTVIAIISAGPDQQFQTSCLPYDGSAPEGVNKPAGTDDIVTSLSYSEASEEVGGQVSSLWELGVGPSGASAEIDKDILVLSSDPVNDPRRFSVDGDAQFSAIKVNEVYSANGSGVAVSINDPVLFAPQAGGGEPDLMNVAGGGGGAFFSINSANCSNGETMNVTWESSGALAVFDCN